jgi:hypothetical protein
MGSTGVCQPWFIHHSYPDSLVNSHVLWMDDVFTCIQYIVSPSKPIGYIRLWSQWIKLARNISRMEEMTNINEILVGKAVKKLTGAEGG